MARIALYREWRPQTFADVVGQQHVTRTLRHAVVQQRLAHAYLFSGPRGTGKTSVARLLAKAVNCLDLQAGDPCNNCSACHQINAGRCMDIIEIDAASNRGIDEIREVLDKVRYTPVDLRTKVYIVDEVHMLTEPAFNALLKTLEEPPSHAMFVLATTESHKVPATILSRCQRHEFHRLTSAEMIGRLDDVCRQEGVTVDPEALATMARQAEGGLRDALSLLDQVLSYVTEGDGVGLGDTLAVLGIAPVERHVALTASLFAGDVPAVLVQVSEVVHQGKDLRQFVRDYLQYLRDLLLVKVGAAQALTELSEATLTALREQAGAIDQGRITAVMGELAELEGELRYAPNPRLAVEIALIRLTTGSAGQPAGAAISPPVSAAGHPGGALAVASAAVPASAQAAVPAAPTPAPAAGADGGFDIPAADLARRPAAPAPAQHPRPPAPVPASAADSIGEFTSVWPQLLDLFGGKKHLKPFQALLREGTPTRINGRTLYIGFPPAYPVHREKVAARRDWVEKALEHLGYPGMRVDTEFTENGPAGAPAAPDIVDLVRRRLGDVPIVEISEEESR